MCRLPLVHTIFAALIDDTNPVDDFDIVMRKAHRLDKLHTGNAGGTRTNSDNFGLLDVPAR